MYKGKQELFLILYEAILIIKNQFKLQFEIISSTGSRASHSADGFC